MNVSTTNKKFGLEQAFMYLHKDPEHPYYGYIRHIINDIDPNVM